MLSVTGEPGAGCWLVVLCGLPGSGKSTWRRRNWRGRVVCPDEIRLVFHGRPADPAHEGEVWATAYRWLGYWLRRGEDVLFDATNVVPERRAPLIRKAREHGARVRAVVVDMGLEMALERNRKRPHPVPEKVIRRMAESWVCPGYDEGFDEIYRVGPGGELVRMASC